MLNLLGASTILGTILDFLGVAGIIIFGAFLVIIVIDLILAATSDKEGLFFNKGKKEKTEKQNDNDVNVYDTPAPETQEEPVADENGVVYYNTPNEEEQNVSAIDFDKAVEEQQALQDKLEEPQNDFYVEENEEDEEDI